MDIISMCTYSYKHWVYSFYHSIKRSNPEVNITIYLVNFPEDEAHLMRYHFPDVTFYEHNGTFPLKQTHNFKKDVYLVTFLKGIFIEDFVKKHRKDCLWVDITALIRKDISEAFEKLEKSNCVLVHRGGTKAHKKYAAEIFGITGKNPAVSRKYSEACKMRRNLWFADQISLNVIADKHVSYLTFGDYCNFYYESYAKTWSDRGKTGEGKLEEDDADYSMNKFLEDLQVNREDYEKYLNSFGRDKPKILVFTDDEKWCFHNSAKEIVRRLANDFSFTLVHALDKNREKINKWNGDFIWTRCGANRAGKLIQRLPAYENKAITTITTGGEGADKRLTSYRPMLKKHLGVFTQNTYTENKLKELGINIPVYNIPNGVDTQKFKPMENNNSRVVVGFAGRNGKPEADSVKGYSQFIVPSITEDERLLVADSTTKFRTPEKMPEFFQECDLLMQPSLYEGCSNTLMEAMACGIPCIITKTGYHSEVCTDEVVYVERDLNDIKEKKEWIKKPRNYKKVSKKAREFAEKHDWEIIAGQFRDAFNDIYQKLYKSNS